jgi:hypothetical protein
MVRTVVRSMKLRGDQSHCRAFNFLSDLTQTTCANFGLATF